MLSAMCKAAVGSSENRAVIKYSGMVHAGHCTDDRYKELVCRESPAGVSSRRVLTKGHCTGQSLMLVAQYMHTMCIY